MTETPLFDIDPDPEGVAAAEYRARLRDQRIAERDLSPGRRLTLRQRRNVDAGIHPLTREPTHPELGTCGDCVFKEVGDRWNKCLEPDSPRSRGPVTDVRNWWPACPRFKPKET